MIAYIKGKIADKTPAYAVIDCHGVGYFIHITIHTYSKLPETGQVFLLYTHFHVREDAQTLYGFAEKSERDLFRHLISVSGVGPTTALVILSSVTTNELYRAIADQDVNMLKSIKGIGPKSAQRIILDLSDKINKKEIHTDLSATSDNTKRMQALSALASLGFSRTAAGKALDKVKVDSEADLKVEELIKRALMYL